jgi:intracellular multiplication protein IcmG
VSDDKNNIMSDDEYQFPKDEYLNQTATAKPDVNGQDSETISDEKIVKRAGVKQVFERFPILKNKKFYFGVGFVVVIIIGVNMMHHGSSKKVVTQAAPVVQTAKPVMTVEKPTSQLLNQLDSIKSDQASNQDTLSQLQSHISGLNTKLNSAAAANAQLAQSVTMLTAQVRLLANDVQKNTKLLTPKPKKVTNNNKPVYHPKPITYDVKAIVPGRAWIVSSTGDSYSVTVGDKIEQYGHVKAIDDNDGRVFTTSGKVIAYGPNDY